MWKQGKKEDILEAFTTRSSLASDALLLPSKGSDVPTDFSRS